MNRARRVVFRMEGTLARIPPGVNPCQPRRDALSVEAQAWQAGARTRLADCVGWWSRYMPQAHWIRARAEALVTVRERFVPVPFNLVMLVVSLFRSPTHRQLPIPHSRIWSEMPDM